MLDKIKLKLTTNPELKQKLKIALFTIGGFSLIYFVTDTVSKNNVREKPPIYKLDASVFNANEAESEFEKEGLYSKINELKDNMNEGARENERRIVSLENQLKKEQIDKDSLRRELKTAQEEADKQVQDKMEIFVTQVKEQLKGLKNTEDLRIDIGSDIISAGNSDVAEVKRTEIDKVEQSVMDDYASLMQTYENNIGYANEGRSSDVGAGSVGGVVGAEHYQSGGKTALDVRIVKSGKVINLDAAGNEIKPKKTNTGPESVTQNSKETKTNNVSKSEQLVKNAEKEPESNSAYLPSGSLIQGILISGVDAPTDKEAQAEPLPVTIRVKKEAILPNRFRLDIRECFITGASFAKLNTSRAYIRSEKISCIRNDGGVIESPLKAYAMDQDGKIGLHGQIISKQGQVIARSILSGFLEGVADGFKPEEVPVVVDTTNGDTLYQKTRPSDLATIAGYNGLASGFKKASEFYAQIAQDLYPVIEIGAGRKIELILTSGTSLAIRG
ncbi:hypothetical protein A3715_15655 [Oleiphilus sp. HI0009]|nr:hypothetical protein A3715_15655 [Oleiphilus sp. HI0009]